MTLLTVMVMVMAWHVAGHIACRHPLIFKMLRWLICFGICWHLYPSRTHVPRAIIRLCLEKGWISPTAVTNDRVVYIFPSLLHRMYIEWSLLPISATIPFATPLAMSIAAIQRFRPSHLYDPPRRVGDAGAVRPPEATYQDEFYRSILEVTGGCIRISSEYSLASVARPGRVDFFSYLPRSGAWNFFMMGIMCESTRLISSWMALLEDGWNHWI